MTSRPPSEVGIAFERRAARADGLARESSAAQAPLEFAAGLYRAQGALVGAIESAHLAHPLVGRLDQDLPAFADHVGGILRFAADRGPQALGAEARARAHEDPRSRLLPFWRDDAAATGDYLSRAMLRPYAEMLAALAIPPDRPRGTGGCPFCSGRPWIGCRRAVTDGDGGQRYLGCALCGGDWPVNRIRCPACGEEDPDRLPQFHSERYPSVRLEACVACHVYVKSIDLTLDARAIPEVDDLLSLSMDLWAGDEGFTRMEPGLAGI